MIPLTLLILAVDIAPRQPPACTVDGDCMMSTFSGCCGACCPPPPYAISRANDAAQRRRCAAVDCAARSCPDVVCARQEPVTAYRAACQSGQCVAVRATPAPVCRADADCRVDYSIGVNGCPGNPTAVPVTTPQPPQPVRPLTKKDDKPQFGLTPGGPGREPVACPAPPPARAACSAGRCVLVRTFDE